MGITGDKQMQLTDYKDNNEPWTLNELNLIATSMGDFSLINSVPNSIRKFVYQRPVDKNVYPWLAQNVENKTPIKYSDYIKLANQQTSYLTEYEKSTKQDKPMANRTGKYLSLKIKDGEANTRSLIFQAYTTGINDPRPFIKELINSEKKLLKKTINDINLYSIEYGYNVKLASLVSFGKQLKQKLYDDTNYELSLRECINIYLSLDESEQFHIAKEIHEEIKLQWIDPYTWIKDYLTTAVLSVPKPKVLFDSNKLKIHIKDGYIYLFEKKLNMESRAEIKLDVKSNTYYI